jgi:hypothetical protein
MTWTISATGCLERIGTKPNSRSAELIWIHATPARIRIACEKMTAPALGMLRDSVECAASLPTRPRWERKGRGARRDLPPAGRNRRWPDSGEPRRRAGFAGQLMHAVGPAANGMITSSRRRLPEHLLGLHVTTSEALVADPAWPGRRRRPGRTG